MKRNMIETALLLSAVLPSDVSCNQFEQEVCTPLEGNERLTGRRRKRCGARARSRGGAPCQCKVVPGRTRCKFHGGMSTGPKTPEGKARSIEGTKRYFAERRAKVLQLSSSQ
jgi:hypothetical protein